MNNNETDILKETVGWLISAGKNYPFTGSIVIQGSLDLGDKEFKQNITYEFENSKLTSIQFKG